MKTAILALALALDPALGDELLWVLQDETTPQSLAAEGAVLLSTDSIEWPEGASVRLSYWRGAADALMRCAELYAADTVGVSCWVEESPASAPTGATSRHFSTRRRPTGSGPASAPIYPHVWLNAWR